MTMPSPTATASHVHSNSGRWLYLLGLEPVMDCQYRGQAMEHEAGEGDEVQARQGLGQPLVVERGFAWAARFRRLARD